MTTLYLVRHGNTNGNVRGWFQGSFECPLNERGHAQGKCLEERFSQVHLDALYTSTLGRARATAGYIANATGLMPILCPNLREVNGGALEGRSFEENMALYPEHVKALRDNIALFAPPFGETGRDCYNRICDTIMALVRKHEGQTIAMVSHGFVLQLFVNYIQGRSVEEIERQICGNTGVSKLAFRTPNSAPDILYLYDTSHLHGYAAE